MNDLVEMITCKQCSQVKPASRYTPRWCVDCEKAYNNRQCHLRRHQDGWIDIAKDSELELYERQPGETQLEWSIWQAYRDSYPGAKPTYKVVAAKVNTTYDFVRKTAGRWDFQIRMQAWIAECDRLTAAQRRQEVLDMNKDYVDMSVRLRQKLSAAIDNIDVYNVKPSEISSLMKTAAELEKKARVDTMERELHMSEGLVDTEDPNIKKSPTKQEDLGEVLQILLKAGALGEASQLGIRKTTTTEVVVHNSEE